MTNEHKYTTIPFDIGFLSKQRKAELKALPDDELAQHKEKIGEQHEQKVPLGPYPWKTKSSGWVQVWFTPDSDINYVYIDWGMALSIKIEVKKKSGTVSVLGRSEVFDDVKCCMVLQEIPWRQQISGKCY